MFNYGIRDVKGIESSMVLKDVRINGNVCGGFAEITIIQKFENKGNEYIDGLYMFPIPENAVISGFEADFGGKSIRAAVDDKEKAMKVYSNAVERGETTFMLEEVKSHKFQIGIGRIMPGETVDIKLSYIDELKYLDDSFILSIPAVSKPRQADDKTYKKILRKTAKKIKGSSVDYSVRMNIIVESMCNMEFDSPSHYIGVERDGENIAKITLDPQYEYEDDDFILVMKEMEDEEASGMIYEYNEGEEHNGIIYLRLLPKLDEYHEERNENYIFLIDVSDTMAGNKIEEAKAALQLCIRNLSQGDAFNIVAMGEKLKFFSEQGKSQFDADTLRSATKWINDLQIESDADIFGAIKFSLEKAGDGNIILIFTDDEVEEEDEVLKYAESNIGNNRIFTFGIDSSVNSYFLNKLASDSYGKAEFIFPGQRMEDVVLRQFTRIENPQVDDLKIHWGNLKIDCTYPRSIDYMYDREPFEIFARFGGDVQGEIKLTGKVGDKDYVQVVDLDNFYTEENANLVEKVWARKRIRSIEMSMLRERGETREAMREKVVELSKRHNLLSLHTSFLLIEEREEKVLGMCLKNIIPLKVKEVNLSNDIVNDIRVNEDHEAGFIFKAHQERKNDTEYLDKNYPRERILRIIAKNQFADGSFVDYEDRSVKDKLETTLMALLAFAYGDEDVTIYLNQLNKSMEFVLNAVEANNELKDEKIRELLGISLKASMNREVIKSKNIQRARDAIESCCSEVRDLNSNELLVRKIASLFNISSNGKEINEELVIGDENTSIFNLAKLAILQNL